MLIKSFALSFEGFAWLTAWTATILASTLVTLAVVRTQPEWRLFRESALWASTLATLPGSALLVEFIARLAHAGWTSGPEVKLSSLTMTLPAVLALFIGPLLLTASFILPSGHKDSDFFLPRVSHVAAWASSAAATVAGMGGW